MLTDDDRIASAADEFGADVIMTSPECRNGTERCSQGADLIPKKPDLVINLQGDAPLTPPHYVEDLITCMSNEPDTPVATPVLKTEPEHLAKLQGDRRSGRVGATTAVFGVENQALYFSKEIVPFYDNAGNDAVPVFHHVGCYAYRPSALQKYVSFEEGHLELREGLEQLRFLENGILIRCVEVQSRGREFWELNNPSDVPVIEGIMKREGIE